jgi:Ca2+-binding EF-hand superfamily protein
MLTRHIGPCAVLSLLAMAVGSRAREAVTNLEPVIAVSPLSAKAVKARVKDADQDGKISVDEFMREAAPETQGTLADLFKAADKDQDGALSPEELEGLGRATPDEPAAPVVRKADPSTGDTDGDGKISLEEFTSGATGDAYNTTMLQGLFRSRDVNGDGFLSGDELDNLPGRPARSKKGANPKP